MRHLPRSIEVNVRALKRGVGVIRAVVKLHSVTVGLIVSAAPLLAVFAVEVRRQDGLSTVIILGYIISVVDDVPIASLVDPEVPAVIHPSGGESW